MNLPKKLQAEAPFIAAVGLTRLASESKRAIDAEMRSKFDRPTPWAMRAIAIEKATKQTLRSRVGLQDETLGKGGYWSEVLGHQFTGGGRTVKRFERAMMKARLLPPGHYAVPFRDERTDPFGNLPRGKLTQLMSYMQAWRESGYRANMSDERRKVFRKKTKKFFFLALRSDPRTRGLKPGIWATDDKQWSDDQPSIRPVLLFQKGPRYKQRIDLHRVAQSVADRRWGALMVEALASVVK
ncbi:hypothetical protein ACW73L_07395 [Methylolobus aquaticus]